MTQCWVVDLGCGSGLKTRVIVEAIAASMPTTLFAIDISAAALRQCAFTMSDLTAVKVTSFEGSYLPGLEALRDSRQNDAPLLALFLGSSISQFAVHEIEPFLGQVRALMRPGDAILIGADGIRSLAEMIAQYNDVLGIEAAFDKNALNVVNRTLGGNFDIAALAARAGFVFQAEWRDAKTGFADTLLYCPANNGTTDAHK
ncbi:L-histidine N(alpha)-methyltransferase [Robbsia sp. KACC 23696]|uniref:L-histidine N(alpha)-methyltransferase n=1 Tax=Robbsia sp. KACC 23696 TaxID=3149231 RepID=UPI00325A6E3E